jgi:MFS family permease
MPPVAGWVSDKYGRRAGLMLGSIITLAGGLLGAFSTNLGMFIGGRVLVGAGQACHQAIAPPLLQEFAHPVGDCRFQADFSVSVVYVAPCISVSFLSVAFCPPSLHWE